jgi:sugar/nucleoside kinase (ribokinase family)
MTADVQLLGISNAIVDVLAHVDDELIEKIGSMPGSMNLIDEQRAHEIYEMMGPATEMSGGSVANTIAGFANLGARYSITICAPWASTSGCNRRRTARRQRAATS